MWKWGLLLVLAMVGCSKPRPAWKMSMMGLGEAEKYKSAHALRPPDASDGVMMTIGPSGSPGALPKQLMDASISYRMGELSNPGVYLYLCYSSASLHGRLSADQEAALKRIAASCGGEIRPSWQVPPVFGPDGKTEMVLGSTSIAPIVYAPTASGNVERQQSQRFTYYLSFPSRKQAEQAGRYISSTAFKVTISSEKASEWVLKAKPQGQMSDSFKDEQDLAKLAKSFGGKYEYAETTTEMPG